MRKKRDIIITSFFAIVFIAGLSVMFYPTFSNWWNQSHQSHAVNDYKEAVAELDTSETEMLWAEAQEYNRKLAELDAPFSDYERISGYDDILNVSGTGVMGYISIPSIRVELPVYHGTSESILQIAAGHIRGSSLPVGGANTHSVISGHRGLPSAKLFTDLDQMVEGDIFTVNILNDILTYEVEKILIILPDETDKLSIIPDKDYVTLMTCTPYGINSHRLLIRAHRIDNINDRRVKVPADALQVERTKVTIAVFGILFFFTVIYWIISGQSKRNIRIDKYIIDKLPSDKE